MSMETINILAQVWPKPWPVWMAPWHQWQLRCSSHLSRQIFKTGDRRNSSQTTLWIVCDHLFLGALPSSQLLHLNSPNAVWSRPGFSTFEKNISFEWPTPTDILCDIWPDILSDILSEIFSGILWNSIWNLTGHIFWHSLASYGILSISIWHFFLHSFWNSTWHSIWHFIWRIFWHSIILYGILFDIVSDIVSGILSDILSCSLSDILNI